MGRTLSGWLLARALRVPESVATLDAAGWNGVIAMARAEQMIGTLAWRLADVPAPAQVARILDDACASVAQTQVAVLWEAEAARRVILPLGVPLVLLAGAAFAAGGMRAGVGRWVDDLEILVPGERMDAVEAALLDAGWERVVRDRYDDRCARTGVPGHSSMIHRERGRRIDIHHTILPPTVCAAPDPTPWLADIRAVAPGMFALSANDCLLHAAVRLSSTGGLADGMRILWDVQCLVAEFGTDGLASHAQRHGLAHAVARALRLAEALYGDAKRVTRVDRLYLHHITARDGWGRPTRPLVRMAFHIRGQCLGMSPARVRQYGSLIWGKGGARPASV